MKKIFLIGDSIRFGFDDEKDRNLGYGYHIKQKLYGKAEVYYPFENCRFLMYTLRYLGEWKAQLGLGDDIDIVHWNNGLWDVLRLYGDEPFTPIEQYKEQLVRVYKRIKLLFPKAKVYFSLSTPIIQEQAGGDFSRDNADIEKYNEEAIKVLEPLGVEIIDLYSKAKTLQPKYSKDWVHYVPEGAEILADYIIDKLNI